MARLGRLVDGCALAPRQAIVRECIGLGVEEEDMKGAAEEGKVVKLVAEAVWEEGLSQYKKDNWFGDERSTNS